MKVHITGAAGYIGSHIVVELLEKGYEVLASDNYSNSSLAVYDAFTKIISKDVSSVLQVIDCDLRCAKSMQKVIRSFKPNDAIHLEALKLVTEYLKTPVEYYETNVGCSINL